MTDENRPLAISILAGERILGTLTADERRALEERLGDNPEFRVEVSAWERRLAPLVALVAPVAASTALWSRIEAATFGGEPTAAATTSAANGVVVGLEEAIATRTRQLQTRVARWRWATAAATALAAGLAVTAFLAPRLAGPTPRGVDYVAVVNGKGDLPPLIVRVDLARGELSLEPVQMEAVPGKAHQLWAVAPNAKPVSLGLVTRDRRALDKALQDAVREAPVTIAVSVEPEGGSPTGQPTGPVVYTGKLVALP